MFSPVISKKDKIFMKISKTLKIVQLGKWETQPVSQNLQYNLHFKSDLKLKMN